LRNRTEGGEVKCRLNMFHLSEEEVRLVAAQREPLKVQYVDIDSLKPFEGNPRTISEKGLEKLQRSIEEYGFVNPILAQRGTNMIIAGHQRIKAARNAGLSKVPVIFLDFDEITAKAYNLMDNRSVEESDWDFGLLADLIMELDNGEIDLELTGFDASEIENIINWMNLDDDDGEIEMEEEGEHFVECPKCGFRWCPE